MKQPGALYVLLVWASACLIACGNDSTTRPPAEREVPIIGGYFITLPSTYKAESHTGIDTHVFESRRNDEKVVFRVELGGGTPYERAQFGELPITDRYPNRILFESSSGRKGAYYYEIIPGVTFRGVQGVVVFDAASGAGFEEIFFAEHSEDSLTEVLDILQTLRH